MNKPFNGEAESTDIVRSAAPAEISSSRFDALFSSKTGSHATPIALYQALDAEFDFTLDPCPLTERDGEYAVNGLSLSWEGQRVFCNPPYGRGVGEWLKKAPEAELAVYLLPSRTDTKWWHTHAIHADETRFVKGRLKFGEAKTSAPFPSVVLIFHSKSGRTSAFGVDSATPSDVSPLGGS